MLGRPFITCLLPLIIYHTKHCTATCPFKLSFSQKVFPASPFAGMRSMNKLFLTLLCFHLVLIHHQLCLLLKVLVGNCTSIYQNHVFLQKASKLHLQAAKSPHMGREAAVLFHVWSTVISTTAKGEVYVFCTISGLYSPSLVSEGDSGLLLD